MAQYQTKVVSEPKTPGAKTYEIMFILESGKNEKDRTETLEKIRKHLEEHKAHIQFEDLTWGERMMTYRIKGSDYGYYGVFVFDALPKELQNLEHAIRVESGVLRVLITAVPQNYKLVKYTDAKEFVDIVPNAPKTKLPPKKKTIKEQNLEEILSQEI